MRLTQLLTTTALLRINLKALRSSPSRREKLVARGSGAIPSFLGNGITDSLLGIFDFGAEEGQSLRSKEASGVLPSHTERGFTLVSGVVLPPPRGLVAAGAFLHLWCPACLSLLEASSEELSFSLARRAEAQSKLRCRRNLSLLSPGGHWTARKNKQGIMRHRGLKTAPLNPSDLSLPAQLGPPHLDSARAGAREPAGPQHPLSQYKAPQAAGTFCKPDFGQKHQI